MGPKMEAFWGTDFQNPKNIILALTGKCVPKHRVLAADEDTLFSRIVAHPSLLVRTGVTAGRRARTGKQS